MEVSKSIGKFDLFSVDHNGTVRPFTGFFDIIGQGICVDAQKPFDPGFFKDKIAGSPVVGVYMYDVFLYTAEDSLQHIKKVNPDIGGYAT